MHQHYINETLLKDEKLIYFSRPHWIIFGPAITALIIALAFLIWGPSYSTLQFHIWKTHPFYELLAAAAGIIGLYWLLIAYIKFKTSEYAITDRRVLMKTGWIQRNSLEIFLRKLEAINVNQTVPGRIFNYGTLVIIGTGGTEDFYFNVPDPLGFRKRVQQQADLLTDGDDRH